MVRFDGNKDGQGCDREGEASKDIALTHHSTRGVAK